jgi:hypothetical protein
MFYFVGYSNVYLNLEIQLYSQQNVNVFASEIIFSSKIHYWIQILVYYQ